MHTISSSTRREWRRCCLHCTWHTQVRPWSVTSAAHRAALAGRSSASTLQPLWCNCASMSEVLRIWWSAAHRSLSFSVGTNCYHRLFVPHHRPSMFSHQAFSVAGPMGLVTTPFKWSDTVHLTVSGMIRKIFFSQFTTIYSALEALKLCTIYIYDWQWHRQEVCEQSINTTITKTTT